MSSTCRMRKWSIGFERKKEWEAPDAGRDGKCLSVPVSLLFVFFSLFFLKLNAVESNRHVEKCIGQQSTNKKQKENKKKTKQNKQTEKKHTRD